MPLIEEEIDGLSGLLFPFYDADTHMLYLAGKVRAVLRVPQLRELRHLPGRRRGLSPANCVGKKRRPGSRAVLSPKQNVTQLFGHETLVWRGACQCCMSGKHPAG